MPDFFSGETLSGLPDYFGPLQIAVTAVGLGTFAVTLSVLLGEN